MNIQVVSYGSELWLKATWLFLFGFRCQVVHQTSEIHWNPLVRAHGTWPTMCMFMIVCSCGDCKRNIHCALATKHTTLTTIGCNHEIYEPILSWVKCHYITNPKKQCTINYYCMKEYLTNIPEICSLIVPKMGTIMTPASNKHLVSCSEMFWICRNIERWLNLSLP